MLNRIAGALALFFVMGAVQAADTQIVTTMNKQEFQSYEAQVTKDLNDGKRYSEIAPDDKLAITNTFVTMDARWQKADSAGILSPDDVHAMETDLASVDALLHRAAVASRLICSSEAPMGSHISKRVCRTQASIDRDTAAASSTVRDMQSHQSQPLSGH